MKTIKETVRNSLWRTVLISGRDSVWDSVEDSVYISVDNFFKEKLK